MVGGIDGADSPVDNSKSKSDDDETDAGVKDGVFGLFDFACVTGRSHIANATFDEINDGDESGNADDGVEQAGDRTADASASIAGVDGADNKISNSVGETNDDETDEGIVEGGFGFLELARIACGGDIADAADYYKDSTDDASDADEPTDSVVDEVCFGNALRTDAVGFIKGAGVAQQSDASGADDNVGESDNSKTDKSASESLFAGGGFARIAGSEDVKIAAINNEANGEIGGKLGDGAGDVAGDNPDVALKVALIPGIW